MNCQYCEKESFVFTLMCSGCRTRIVQQEFCKYLRGVIVNQLESAYGEVLDWKGGKHCECKVVCERKEKIKQDKMTYVEQTNRERPKASRRR